MQPDLFAAPTLTGDQPSDEIVSIVSIVRARLRAALALVKRAEVMPWDDMLTIIREDNAFRFGNDVLPPDEGSALWAEFNVEMDRLYAIMNAGKDLDMGG